MRITGSMILEYLLMPAILALALTLLNQYVFPNWWDEEPSLNVWVEFILFFSVCIIIVILYETIIKAVRKK